MIEYNPFNLSNPRSILFEKYDNIFKPLLIIRGLAISKSRRLFYIRDLEVARL